MKPSAVIPPVDVRATSATPLPDGKVTVIEPLIVCASSEPLPRSSMVTSTEPLIVRAVRTVRPCTWMLPFTVSTIAGPSFTASIEPLTVRASSVMPCGTVMSNATDVSLSPLCDDSFDSSQPRFASGG